MDDAISTIKWVAGQSDRVLFIVTLCICGWFAWRQQKRSEAMVDTLREELHANRDQLVVLVREMSGVVSANTELVRRNIHTLERIEERT